MERSVHCRGKNTFREFALASNQPLPTETIMNEPRRSTAVARTRLTFCISSCPNFLVYFYDSLQKKKEKAKNPECKKVCFFTNEITKPVEVRKYRFIEFNK